MAANNEKEYRTECCNAQVWQHQSTWGYECGHCGKRVDFDGTVYDEDGEDEEDNESQ